MKSRQFISAFELKNWSWRSYCRFISLRF